MIYNSTYKLPNLTGRFNPVFCKETKAQPSDRKTTYLLEAGTGAVSVATLLAYRAHNNSYRVKLAKDLSKVLGERITAKNLKSVMTRSELLKELPKLVEQNYVASNENIKNGIFLADLHSHSNFSDGKITVENLLNQAASYGDKLEKLNGKKFIFALTDHDGIEGVKEALKIIAKNPERFKNVKFVPASEISFVLPCQENSARYEKFKTGVQMPEMLIYGINPFSENTKKFFDGIYSSREKQILSAISKGNDLCGEQCFSKEEYLKHFHIKGKKLCFLNQHWKIFNYLLTKFRITKLAQEEGKNPEELYSAIAKELKGINPHNLNEHIKSKYPKSSTDTMDSKLKNLIEKEIFPLNEADERVKTEFEIHFRDIVEYSRKENAVLGFAHPAFTMQNFSKDKLEAGMQKLVEESHGQVKFAEKFHQAYPIGHEIQQGELEEYNSVLDRLKLVNIGGRDNHKDKFIQ